jgi:two-component sensor histidine kinase
MNLNGTSSSTEKSYPPGQQHSFQILNQMPFPVEVCDSHGSTTMVNAAFLDTFEVPPAGRIVGQLRKLGRDTVLDEVRAGKKCVAVELTVEPGDLARTYSPGKGPVIFEATVFPLLSPHGEVLQIVALWRDVTDRKQAAVKMQTSLQEKELLLKEIHHRVKNNLQVISSLLSLQGSSIRDAGVRRLFEEARDRVRSMASIHEMLYASSDLARIDFSSYVSVLASQLFSSCNISLDRVKLEINVEPVTLGINLGVPCGLLINELVTNALRHAFPNDRAGTITVSMRELPDHSIRLAVRDDGVGLPSDLDVENAESLGFQLVTTLVGQLNGTLEVKRENGTEFVVVF